MDDKDLDSISDFDEWCRVLAYKMNHYAFGALYYESNPTKAEKRILDGLDRGIKNACRQRVADRAAKSSRDTWVSIQTVGDTCKYCTSRSGTWHPAGGGFADAFHGFHSKCDCHVAVSFDKGENVEYRYRSDNAGIPLSDYTDAYKTKRTPSRVAIGATRSRLFDEMMDRINNGILRITQNQKHHVKGKNFDNVTAGRGVKPSTFNMSLEESEELVLSCVGQGYPGMKADGTWDGTEIVKLDRIIGTLTKRDGSGEVPTKILKIVYSDRGVHGYPIYDKNWSSYDVR